jgi:uncharacterized membrane protein SpoIIM required for sporulation
MVLELLVNPKKVTGKPSEMIILGFVYVLISVLVASWMFKSYVSIVMITLTIVASIPLVNQIISLEEKKDLTIHKERRLLKEHSKAIKALLYLFIGYTLAFILLYVFLPSHIIAQMFSAQLETITTIKATSVTGNYVSYLETFNTIFLNNLKILIFCIAFSFFYGAGAIFILTWNASIMATAIGAFIRNNIIHTDGIMGYLQVSAAALLQYALHGIPEITAYFIGALASGMISFAVVKHEFMGKNFKIIISDVLDLIMISVGILFFAALIEVFITPLII